MTKSNSKRTFLSLFLLFSLSATAYANDNLPGFSKYSMDYDGDGIDDLAVFRPDSGEWFIRGSTRGAYKVDWGIPGDIPTPGYFEGPDRANIAVFRPSSGSWIIRKHDGSRVSIQLGQKGDVPTVGDYDGDGIDDLSFFRPVSKRDGDSVHNLWVIRRSSDGVVLNWDYGLEGYIPIQGDYDGDGRTDRAVFFPSPEPPLPNRFFFLGSTVGNQMIEHGIYGDRPVPRDYNGDGTTDIAVYRPSTGEWDIRGSESNKRWGALNDLPVPGDYDGDGRADLAVYRRGQWFIRSSEENVLLGQAPVRFGARGDDPVIGDFDQDGKVDLAVFRAREGRFFAGLSGEDDSISTQFGAPVTNVFPWKLDAETHSLASYNSSTGIWRVLDKDGAPVLQRWGGPFFTPVPGDFDGDGTTDIAVYRRATGEWIIELSSTGDTYTDTFGGFLNAIPMVADFNGDGMDDRVIYNNGDWYIRFSDNTPQIHVNFGGAGFTPVIADFSGNGTPDIAVYRRATGTWHAMELGEEGFTPLELPITILGGQPGDIPIPGDFDGDGKADIAFYRRGDYGQWWIFQSSNHKLRTENRPIAFGSARDIPGGQVIATVDTTPPLEELIGTPGPGGGFLWKPHSESTGNLAVLLPPSLTDGFREAWLADKDGNRFETGAYRGVHNGGREHYFFSQHGRAYNNVFVVSYDRAGNLVHWPIANGGGRTTY